MNMKIIEWFKSLFKKKESLTAPVSIAEDVINEPVEEAKPEAVSITVEPKPVKKTKKRGRPRKKKKEENPQQA